MTAFLDLASRQQRWCVVDDTRVLSERIVTDHHDEASLLSLLEDALHEAKVTKNDLTHLACVLGPGGFMSIRVAATLINTLSYLLKIPSCGIHQSDLWHARTEEKDVLWLHSTRKTQFFIRGFGKHEKEWPEATLMETHSFQLSAFSFVGELIPEHEELMTSLGARRANVQSLAEILPTFLSAQTYAADQTLLPWYGRSI